MESHYVLPQPQTTLLLTQSNTSLTPSAATLALWSVKTQSLFQEVGYEADIPAAL